MNLFRLLLRMLWRWIFYFNVTVTFIILYPAFHVLLQTRAWFGKVFWLKRIWAKIIIATVGIRCKIIKAPVLDTSKAYVFCPNHSSYLDIVLMYRSVNQYFHFMGKAELNKVPLFNRFFARMNILVNRQSIMGAHRAFIRAGADIDKGISISIFPEATLPECTPKLGRFKNGAFKLAIEKQVPIVPILFLDNWWILPDNEKDRLGGRPGVARIVIHEPIETIGLTENDQDELKNKVQKIMNQTLLEYGVIIRA